MPQLQNTRKIQKSLLDWYEENKRDLPWRKTRDPYAIWISEIMLQQTQVQTVIPYFKRWMEKFPNVKTLARAEEEKVLKAWEGLGYYSRARNLHRAAKEIIAKHNGHIPDTKEVILSLPGIGRYTAGAILSIAFDQPLPLVDGNVIRVITRLFNILANVDSISVQKKIWDLATSLVPEKIPGDFNQALMELGATVCVPGTPRCLICPLNDLCLSLKKSDPSLLPIRNSKLEIINFRGWIFLIENKGRLLIQKRPHGKVMGGLWEFPATMDGKIKDPEKILENELGIAAKKEGVLGNVKAAFTKYRGIYQVARMKLPKKTPLIKKGTWINKKDVEQFTFSAPSRKVLGMLGWSA